MIAVPPRATRLYVSGKMRGQPDLDRTRFMDAARIGQELGHAMVTPFDKEEENGHPDMVRKYVLWDIKAILDTDGIVMLPTFAHSSGARAELMTRLWVSSALDRHPIIFNERYEPLVPTVTPIPGRGFTVTLDLEGSR